MERPFATAARLEPLPGVIHLPVSRAERAQHWLSRRPVPASLVYAIVATGIIVAGLGDKVPS